MSTDYASPQDDSDQTAPLPSQTLYFNKTADWTSEMITAPSVVIVPGDGAHSKGSSRVKVRSLVDSAWDRGYTWGNLVACHPKEEYVAYALKVPGKTEGVVRVLHTQSNNRILLKGFRGQIRDLAFAFHPSRTLLASVDEFGLVLVYEIIGTLGKLLCQIEQSMASSSTDYCRVLWCPYIPETSSLDPESDFVSDLNDRSLLLGVTHGNRVEIWDLGINEGGVSYDTVSSGVMAIRVFQKPVVDASFAPDGTAIALAGLDGYVRFFTVSLNKQEPSTLHEWVPHDGKPVTSISFLDDLTNPSPDNALWKAVVTSTDFCSELKVWSCETWTAYQTIKFQSEDSSNRLMQKIYLNRSASFLLVTDVLRKVMYVMQIDQDADGYRTKVNRITQLLLSFSPISLAIRKAETEAAEALVAADEEEERELGFGSAEGGLVKPVLLDFYVVQPKSLQECKVLFYPGALPSDRTAASFSLSSAGGSLNTTSASLPDIEAAKPAGTTFNLLTPEAFASPSRVESTTKPAASPMAFSSNLMDLLLPGNANEITSSDLASNAKVDEVSTPENGINSGESSPSREVEELLGHRPDTEGGVYEQQISPEPQTDAVSELQEAAAALTSPAYRNSEAPVREDVSLFQETRMGEETPSMSAPVAPSTQDINNYLKDIVSPKQASPHGANGAWPAVPLPRVSAGRVSDQPVALSASPEHSSLLRSLSDITDYMKTQQAQTASLVNEIGRLRAEVAALKASSTPTWFPQLESQISLLFDREMKKMKNLNNPAKIFQSITKLEQTMKTELEKQPAALDRTTFETVLRQEINSAVGGQVSRMESSVRDSLSQLLPQVFRDKGLVESYSQAVAAITTSAVHKAVRDVVSSNLGPIFERSCGMLYSQLHGAFTKGIEELLRGVQSNLENQRQGMEKLTASQLADVASRMTLTTNQCRDVLLAEMNNHFAKMSSSVTEEISSKISLSVQTELQRGFQEQKSTLQRALAAVETRGSTPVPVNTLEMVRSHLSKLVKQGDFCGAFQRALSASDLSTVLYVCEQVDPQQLFASSPCPLPQPVLLSLIQQLSADLGSYTELKLSYLQEAILAVDVRDKVVKEHAPAVMHQLIQQLQAQTLVTSGPVNRKIRMLLLAAQQLQSS